MKIVALYSVKGGVGKTSGAVNLSYLAAQAGARVLLWDLDPQGGSTFILRVKPKLAGGARSIVRGRTELSEALKETDFSRLDLIPSDFSNRRLDVLLEGAHQPRRVLGRLLAPLRASYDFVVLDCAPSASLTSESVLRAADLVLAPVIPSPLSLRTLSQLRTLADKVGPSRRRPVVRAFFSMVDRRRKLHQQVMAETEGDPSLLSQVYIPVSASVEQMGSRRLPLPAFAPRSQAAHAYAALWAAALEALG